jgi:hypothetical protein
MNEIQVFGIIISGLFSIVAYFVKQLHSDFKRVERDLSEVRSNSGLIKTEFKGMSQLLSQRIDFLERRILHIESVFDANSNKEG